MISKQGKYNRNTNGPAWHWPLWLICAWGRSVAGMHSQLTARSNDPRPNCFPAGEIETERGTQTQKQKQTQTQIQIYIQIHIKIHFQDNKGEMLLSSPLFYFVHVPR